MAVRLSVDSAFRGRIPEVELTTGLVVVTAGLGS